MYVRAIREDIRGAGERTVVAASTKSSNRARRQQRYASLAAPCGSTLPRRLEGVGDGVLQAHRVPFGVGCRECART
jgi:hypothetical protein